MRLIALLLPLLLLSGLPARAETAPVPQAHPIAELEQRLEQERARGAKLEKEMKGIKSSLEDTRSQLVGTASQIKENERTLSDLEDQILSMAEEQKEIEVRLGKDKGAIADLLLALERLRRVPPEAVLARPGAPLETAQSAMILESTLPRIYGRAEALRHDLERLQTLIASLRDKKKAALEMAGVLAGQQDKMAGLLEERERLYSRTAKDRELSASEIKRISAQSSNLKDLVKKLEDQERAREQEPRKRRVAKTALPRVGNGQLPVSGVIRIGYGQRDDIGAVSQGLTIDSRPGGLVVAPMGGIVRYTGPFRNYGQLVIIEHQKGYHSLVAGLARIDTVVGQSVAAGEPVGVLGSSQGSEKPSIYYELRHKGQPANPAQFFAELG